MSLINSTWLIGELIQAVLILRLIRIRYWRSHPVFCTFILYDFVRSLFSAICKYYWGRNGYFYSFAWTEPLDTWLLLGAGLEAGWKAYGPVVYLAALGNSLFVSMFLPPPNYHPTGKYGWLLVALFTARSHSMAATMFATVFTPVYQFLFQRWSGSPCKFSFSAHSAILCAFCTIDLALYLSLMFGAPKDPVEAAGLVGQTACLIGWCWMTARPQLSKFL